MSVRQPLTSPSRWVACTSWHISSSVWSAHRRKPFTQWSTSSTFARVHPPAPAASAQYVRQTSVDPPPCDCHQSILLDDRWPLRRSPEPSARAQTVSAGTRRKTTASLGAAVGRTRLASAPSPVAHDKSPTSANSRIQSPCRRQKRTGSSPSKSTRSWYPSGQVTAANGFSTPSRSSKRSGNG